MTFVRGRGSGSAPHLDSVDNRLLDRPMHRWRERERERGEGRGLSAAMNGLHILRWARRRSPDRNRGDGRVRVVLQRERDDRAQN